VLDGVQGIFIQQYNVMSVNINTVIISDISNLHRFQCIKVCVCMHVCVPPQLKPTFTFIAISTSVVRLFQSRLQKHSTFDKVFPMVTYYPVPCLKSNLPPPKNCVWFQHHVLVYCINFEFHVKLCLCDWGCGLV
jgi:hypothetical protein